MRDNEEKKRKEIKTNCKYKKKNEEILLFVKIAQYKKSRFVIQWLTNEDKGRTFNDLCTVFTETFA